MIRSRADFVFRAKSDLIKILLGSVSDLSLFANDLHSYCIPFVFS